MKEALDIALKRLPHGPEFRFLDRLTCLDPGRSGQAEYRVPAKADFLAGHFPGRPMLPGVLLLEAAAQLAGVVAQSDPEIPPLTDLRLAAIRSAKILGAAGPGTSLTVTARVTGRLGALVQAEAEVWTGETVLCRTALVLSGSEAPEGRA